jgi:hypothetical protein
LGFGRAKYQFVAYSLLKEANSPLDPISFYSSTKAPLFSQYFPFHLLKASLLAGCRRDLRDLSSALHPRAGSRHKTGKTELLPCESHVEERTPPKLTKTAETKNRLRLLNLILFGERGTSMKITVAAFAILFAGSLSDLAYAQAQIGVPGLGQVTIGQPPPYDRRADIVNI